MKRQPIWPLCLALACIIAVPAAAQEEITLVASNAREPHMVPIIKSETYTEARTVRVVKLTSTDIPAPVLQACQSVGRVTVSQGNGASMGSSTYLGDGIWLTNRHVVESGGQASVKTKAGEVLPARVTKIFSGPDLAVVETQNVDDRIRPIIVSDAEPKPGMVVYPSGFDKGNMQWHICWPAQIVEFFQSGDLVSSGLGSRKGSISGNSGGPTFDANGQLLAPLWGNSGGDVDTGTGTCISVNPFAARYALLPWRNRMMAAYDRLIKAQYGPGGCSPQYGSGGGGYGGGPIQPPQYMIPSQPQQQQQGPPPSYQPPSYQPQAPAQPPPAAAAPAPSAGVAGPKGDKGDPGPKGADGTVTDEHLAKIIASVRDQLAKDPNMRGRDGRDGDIGPEGPRGEKGEKGDPGEVTEAHLAAIAAILAKDGRLRGPAGKDATVDIDALALAVINRLTPEQLADKLPEISVVLRDGSKESRQSYRIGKDAILLDINRFLRDKAE